MTLLLLIRHGENDVMQRRLTGRMPGVPLNQKGRQQALGAAAALTHAPLKAVYSSPLQRAMETAEPLAQAHHLPVLPRPALMDVDYGTFQGRSYRQAARTKLWKILQDAPSKIVFPGGEGFTGMQARVVEELDTLARIWQPEEPSLPDQPQDEAVIAIVTHADVIRLALAHYLNMPLDDFLRLTVAPGSISMLHTNGKDRPKIICINQQADFHWPEPPPPGKSKKVKRV